MAVTQTHPCSHLSKRFKDMHFKPLMTISEIGRTLKLHRNIAILLRVQTDEIF
jgi:hypothetical protein